MKNMVGLCSAACAVILTACGDGLSSVPPAVPTQRDDLSWEWQSDGAFPKTVVLTLYRNNSATLETWGSLQSTEVSNASYRIETGGAQRVGSHQVLLFDGGKPAPLEFRIQPDGKLDAWWYSAGPANLLLQADTLDRREALEPDMRMRPIAQPATGTRPVDLP